MILAPGSCREGRDGSSSFRGDGCNIDDASENGLADDRCIGSDGDSSDDGSGDSCCGSSDEEEDEEVSSDGEDGSGAWFAHGGAVNAPGAVRQPHRVTATQPGRGPQQHHKHQHRRF